jgi:PTS system N-acetylglucosamine-specific IIC component
VLAAIGGAANLKSAEAAANRLLVTLASAGAIDEQGLRAAGVRAIARTGANRLQLILGEDAAPLSRALQQPA